MGAPIERENKMLQRPPRVAAAIVVVRSFSSAWWSISIAVVAAVTSVSAATREVGESRTCTYLVVAEQSRGSK